MSYSHCGGVVKVTLVISDKSEQNEVRRFKLTNDTPSFKDLKSKLREIFPQLGDTFIITWKDKEGDDIRITSNDELQDAITEISDILRLMVKPQREKKRGSTIRNDGELHANVVCDGCEGKVAGFRYKCLQCPDYDLCAVCEENGLHPGHNMLRLVQPISVGYPWRRFMRRFHRWIPDFENNDSTFPCGQGRRGRGCKRRSEGNNLNCNGDSSSGEADSDKPTGNKKRPQTQFVPPNFGPFLGGLWSGLAGPFEQGQNYGNSDFLRNIGEQVSAMLDPMGINVHVDVEDNGKFKCAEKKQQDCQKQDEKENCCGKTSEDVQEKQTEEPETLDETPKEQPEQQNNMEVEVNAKEKLLEEFFTQQQKVTEEMAEAVASLNIDQNTNVEEGASEGEKDFVLVTPPRQISPDVPATPSETLGAVPKQPTEPQAPNSENETEHPDQRVAKGLRQMVSMGFTNEGGWLTQLLEVKEGDIGQVLDVLLPQRRN